MVRRYDDPVDVRSVDVRSVDVRVIDQLGNGCAPSPDAFVWRGRLYVVLAVLARWQERRAWWRDPAASALLGLGADDSMPMPPPAASTPSAGTTLAQECQVWRVEAAAGRSSPVGVYDLTRTPNATWHLARVAD